MSIIKKPFLLLLLFVFIQTNFVNSQEISWTQKADFSGEGRARAASFSIGDKGYLGTGGFNSVNTKDFWEYNPETDVWTQKADVGGVPRTGAIGLSIGDKGYIGMGSSNTGSRNDFWEYNPTTNSWTQKALFPGQGKVTAVAFSIGDKGYAGTGGTSTTIGNETREFWEYNPSANSWTQKADFGGAIRDRAVGFSIGDKGFIGTGYHFDGTNPISYNDFWQYDAITDSWTEKAAYPGVATQDCAGFALGNNNGYIGMGYLDRTEFWKYDLENNSWSQILYFEGEGRIALTSFSINNSGYVGLGYSVEQSGAILYTDFWELNDETLSIESNDYISSKQFKIFPNPAIDFIKVNSKNQYTIIKEIIIYDIQGREQHRTQDDFIDVRYLSAGTYLVKIETPEGFFTKRFIKK